MRINKQLCIVLLWLGVFFILPKDSLTQEKQNIPKGVKTITQTVFTCSDKFGEYQKMVKEKVVAEYDKQGKLQVETYYDLNDELASKHIYKYNNKKQLASKSCYKADGTLEKRYTYKYDDKGNRIKLLCYRPSGSLINEWAYQYAPDTNKLLQSYYYVKKSLSCFSHYFIYKYEGTKTEVAEYNADRTLICKMVYQKDKGGNLIKAIWYNCDGSLNCRWTYQYDQKGNRIEKSCYLADGTLADKYFWKYIENKEKHKTKVTEYRLERKFGMDEEVPIRQTIYEYEFYSH